MIDVEKHKSNTTTAIMAIVCLHGVQGKWAIVSLFGGLLIIFIVRFLFLHIDDHLGPHCCIC